MENILNSILANIYILLSIKTRIETKIEGEGNNLQKLIYILLSIKTRIETS